jgi:disulfide bond formation protein DsbB
MGLIMQRLLDIVKCIAASPWYWLGLVGLALAMEGLALVYQYAWDYGPCVHCIHVRIWLLGMLAVGLLGLGLRRWGWGNALLHAVNGGLMYGMLQTSLQLLGTERGTIFGSCAMDAGLPDWFALDKWFPTVFGIWEACGYTPELLFGITMAEALVVFSAGMVGLSVLLLIATLAGLRR